MWARSAIGQLVRKTTTCYFRGEPEHGNAMAELIIISWRDIPAQVIARRNRTAEKRELPERFIHAIDRCAMNVGARDSEAYLAEWRRSKPVPCDDDLAVAVEAACAKLEATYDEPRLRALVDAGGRHPDQPE